MVISLLLCPFFFSVFVFAHHASSAQQGQKHPWGEYSLKFKNLVPVTFTPVDSTKTDAQNTLTADIDDRFMCPVTFKSFGRATKACVLKPSGQVVHASVVKDYVEKFGEYTRNVAAARDPGDLFLRDVACDSLQVSARSAARR